MLNGTDSEFQWALEEFQIWTCPYLMFAKDNQIKHYEDNLFTYEDVKEWIDNNIEQKYKEQKVMRDIEYNQE